MTIATTSDYTDTLSDIIKDALLDIRAIDPEESVEPHLAASAKRRLNRMIKAWQAYGNNLWKKETAIVFLDPSVQQYSISSTSTQHFTEESYKFTTLSANAVLGASSISVNSASNMNVGDNLGIVLDDNTRYWTTIASIVSTTIDFTPDTLPAAATSGNKVNFYTTKLTRPFNILSANRIRVNGTDKNEVPLTYLSYQDFHELPNKNTESIPTMYNYDRQLTSGIIQLWPLPSDLVYDLTVVLEKRLADFDAEPNSPDFPQEWYRAIELNLAVECAPMLGKNVGQSFQNLKVEASNALILANSFDNEQGSLRIEPSSGERR